MSKQGAPEGYVEVKDRIVAFLNKYPEGSLQPAAPYRIEELGDQTWIVYSAAAFRHPEDPTPGIGIAWEQYPGKTPFTKGSELMNAETSAWGRALAALGFEVHKSVASAEEVEQAKARSSTDEIAEKVADLPGTKELVGEAVLQQIEEKRKEVGTSQSALLAHAVNTHGVDDLKSLGLDEARMVYAWLDAKKPKQRKAA